MHRTLFIASILITGCAAHVQSAGPAAPPPPPPAAAPAPAAPAVAVVPAQHPAYLHALTDLRAARSYLAKPANVVVKWDENRAIREIDAAIHEIKEASIDDGKNLDDHPPVDAALVWGDRLHRGLELLETARRDVNGEEDNGFARGLKNRALGHIDLAARDIEEGIRDAQEMKPQPPPGEKPGAHPAYLHALSDLREARFLLEKPAKPDVKWDEQSAIREIDAAIKEIKDASIDDGKDLNDHPPIDAGMDHRGRLKRAMEMLKGAADDMEKREDNAFAKGLRKRAVGHVRAAEHEVREAIRDQKHR